MNSYRSVLAYIGNEQESASILSWTNVIRSSQDALLSVMANDALRDRGLVERLRSVGLSAKPVWIDARADIPDALASASRYCDVMVVPQPSDSPGDLSHRQASMLVVAASCPIVLVPPASVAHEVKRVLIGWSDTRESARALHDALPLLQRARGTVQVCQWVYDERRTHSLDELECYLQAQGVKPQCVVERLRGMSFDERMITPTVVDASIAERLLSHAAEMNADLVVTGGYGHARLHEWVLGGVTRTLLGSMTVPVLMSH
ncbi:universal stress protein [Trinickia dinghuensis]|uniref:Universal stress protein n=1 Tax=Trinickia dinghuensis TaxID=2291023 RepID=A0A3D8K447_9BURK|nr:universal stress protein [Trinickia dinghuensis]RDU99381.1 universal stress protein [Trinickia dinghuensis]